MFNSNSGSSSSSGSSNRVNVPEARAALDNMKYGIASELGINLKQGYNGDLLSRQAGYIGGYMVKNCGPHDPGFSSSGIGSRRGVWER